MPEGPEIRRAADLLQAAICHKPLKQVWFKFPALKPFEETLAASTVSHFDTRGKALLTHFSCGLTIYSHNQLYGVWKIAKRGKLPASNRDLRLSLHSHTAAIFLFSASDISVWHRPDRDPPVFTQARSRRAKFHRSGTSACERLREKRFAGKTLAALLLDQGFLAGMGNYLRTEVLFYAGLHPNRRPKDLSDLECERLAETLLSVTRRSYQTGGVTNEAAISGVLNLDGAPYEGYRFAAFERAGKPCYQCGYPIARFELAGRRLYVCGECQVA